MTVTRAQRKKLENKTTTGVTKEKRVAIRKTSTTIIEEKKVVVDETKFLEKSLLDNTEINNKLEQKTILTQNASDSDNHSNNDNSSDTDSSLDNDGSSDNDSSSDNDGSSDDNNSSDDDSSLEDEELEDLLKKAEVAAALTSNESKLEKKKEMKLSKMDPGLSSELYFKDNQGRSRLVSNAIQLVGDKTQSDAAALVVEANNRLEQGKSRKERQQEREKTAGSNWFDMPRTEMTPEIKRDLQVLKMRHVLDRKRHYKKAGKQADPKYFQVGRIIEGPTEFFSARMTNKERKQTIVDELLASEEHKQYYKRKHEQVSTNAKSGGKRDFKKLKAQRRIKH